MNNQRKDARSIFMVAIEEYDRDQWPAFLDDQCADDQELRQRVDELLAAHVDMGSIHVSSPTSTMNESITERVGAQIGPYKLREELGDGGMGVVFAADQKEPIRRKVALKVIKPGMDTREVIARFEVERRALALMDHQNIARVLDAGMTDSGRPYFVMELVRGLSVTKYCDKNKLSIHDRLVLFTQICKAVQHAHQKGIIHRDIKPSNVMVTLHDGVPVPKVIDFGVAKAVDQRLTEGSVYTKVSQMVGTPAYMSPEQAELSGLDIDTRSDIYSLGVLLYELLTGSTPFSKDQLSKADFDEMRRIIRDTDPQRPSDRLSTLRAELISTVSANRSDNQRKLTSTIRGELDWIVMKTLEKDRTRRYETANALAADIQRYLDGEPVVACPPSSIYKFRKFARRNRVVLAAGLLVFASMIVGTGFSIWHANRASIAEQQAQDEREVAAENFRLSLDSLKTAYAFADHLDEEPELEPWHREVLTDAFETCQRLIDRLEGQPEFAGDLMELLVIAGRIHYRMDRLQSAAEAFSLAIEIGEDSNYEHDRSARAILASAYDEMAAVHRALGPSDGLAELRAANKIWLFEVSHSTDDPIPVIKLAKNYLRMGTALDSNGDHASALKCREQALRVCDDWLKSHDDHNVSEARVETLVELSHALAGTGERDRARELAREAYDLASSLSLKPEIMAGSATGLANMLSESRETVEQAESLLDQARELRAQLVTDYPNHIPHLAKYARSLRHLSQFKQRLGKREEAKKLLMEASEIGEGMAHAQSDNILVLNQLAALYVAKGRSGLSLGKLNEGAQFTNELRLREEVRSRRDDVAARFSLAAALTRTSEYHLRTKKREPKKGEALLNQANELLTTIPDNGVNHGLLALRATIALNLAQSLFLQSRNAEAEMAMRQSIMYREVDSARSSQRLKRLAGDLSNLALMLVSQKKELSSAKQMCLKAIKYQEQAISLAISEVEKDSCVVFLSNHFFVLGELHFELSEFRESLACYDRSVELNPNQGPARTAWFAEVYLKQVPAEFRDAKRGEEMARLALNQDPDFNDAMWWLAVAFYQQEKFQEAAEVLQKLLDNSPDDLDIQALLGIMRYRLNDFEEARKLLQKSYKTSMEASLYLVMAVVRSKEKPSDGSVNKKVVEEFFKFVLKQLEGSEYDKDSKKELIKEARAVLQELHKQRNSNDKKSTNN